MPRKRNSRKKHKAKSSAAQLKVRAKHSLSFLLIRLLVFIFLFVNIRALKTVLDPNIPNDRVVDPFRNRNRWGVDRLEYSAEKYRAVSEPAEHDQLRDWYSKIREGLFNKHKGYQDYEELLQILEDYVKMMRFNWHDDHLFFVTYLLMQINEYNELGNDPGSGLFAIDPKSEVVDVFTLVYQTKIQDRKTALKEPDTGDNSHAEIRNELALFGRGQRLLKKISRLPARAGSIPLTCAISQSHPCQIALELAESELKPIVAKKKKTSQDLVKFSNYIPIYLGNARHAELKKFAFGSVHFGNAYTYLAHFILAVEENSGAGNDKFLLKERDYQKYRYKLADFLVDVEDGIYSLDSRSIEIIGRALEICDQHIALQPQALERSSARKPLLYASVVTAAAGGLAGALCCSGKWKKNP